MEDVPTPLTNQPLPSQHHVSDDKYLLEKMLEMVEKNLALTQEISQVVEKTRRYIFWMRVVNVFKFIVIIAPIVFGIWFLSPYLDRIGSAYSVYGDLLQSAGSTTSTQQSSENQPQTISPQDLLQQLKSFNNTQDLEDLLQ